MSTNSPKKTLHMNKNQTEILEYDKNHVWHPYTSMTNPLPSYLVDSAAGVHITLSSGEKLIDGMSSWWSVLHGYNHPELNRALIKQSEKFSHVMFGGLTHQPAVELAQKLVAMTPCGLNKVFLSDSGSVAVEVALKMAIQYWHSKNNTEKHKILTVKNGYHGDTFAAMSVCDPVNGMHQLFEPVLMKNLFAPAPKTAFGATWQQDDCAQLAAMFAKHHHEIAAFIIEPIVQGAGGMRIYHPNYLKTCRALCDQYDVLMIADEIATGLGRTGKLFACEWADISPDIICLGKTLTGGYMTLAATLCTDDVANTISRGEANCFMHGPTFMGNPLACAVANASLNILMRNEWQQQVADIEQALKHMLLPLKSHTRVFDVRVLGAIGVVESKTPVDMAAIQKRFVELGVWIRPFGKLIYIMPPFITDLEQLRQLSAAIKTVLSDDACFQ
ncbi:adenosylmethionine-8-amino-7-oxononanoate aminotransferase [Colwellia chukchiensis]|uniref:Adenosylmethionine-8-amino-7-oxononanoate aminotransferase n=2 Tax=Colwellia chukchiensis TaxID=641665 RepID=A0A1H7MUE2_9GAMM|nr:adenosylmethionine-8-amino-7-oxononanoate aminotransferase [Colwellia chukchiensis]